MFHMSGSEVIFAAEQQLECANGIEDTPFVTVKVTLGEDSNPVVEGFQVDDYIICLYTIQLYIPSIF